MEGSAGELGGDDFGGGGEGGEGRGGNGRHMWRSAVKGKGSEERGGGVGARATSTLVTESMLDLLQTG